MQCQGDFSLLFARQISAILHTHTPDDVIKHALSQGAATGIKVRSKLWTEYIYITLYIYILPEIKS